MGFEPTTPTLARLETLFPHVACSFLYVPNPLSFRCWFPPCVLTYPRISQFGDDRVMTWEEVVPFKIGSRSSLSVAWMALGQRSTGTSFGTLRFEALNSIEPSGRKTPPARYRVGGGRSGVQRQATLGRYGTITPDQARTLARRTLAAAANGEDPVGAARSNRQPAITISEVCDWYLEQAAVGRTRGRRGLPIKQSTLAMDRSRIETHVKPLLGKKSVQLLSSHDFEEMQTSIALGKTVRHAADDGQPRRRGGMPSGGEGVAARTLGMVAAILRTRR